MKSNRNLFILVVAVLLSIVLVASTSALIMSGVREDPVRISVVVDDSGSTRWASFLAGLEQAAKDNGVKLNVVPTGRNFTLKQQQMAINDEIADGADGVVLQIASSRGTEEMISEVSNKVVLMLVDTTADMDVDVEGKSACIDADNLAVGRALANEVRIAFGNDLSGHKLGIVAGNQKQNSLIERMEGFNENIASSGAVVAWTDNSIVDVSERIEICQSQEKADILVALDNTGLEAVCDYALRTGDKFYIFGEGTSIKNVSYLDDGIINSMVVPNEYYMGYQSIVAIMRRLDNKLTPMEDQKISYRVVNRENLFDESNQRALFPVVE
ncbi:hypothetical protein D6855_04730 [Butyrivibrio sp. CB08]|uniref:sugar ABC transporter substrate-binding protein n=1 Tax=Butyrivibrio sp. CB08 TaxID=2364879 RepID=UPI000EA91BF0|nr:substrate-binding domain-containing protein [Butyrivibrio sp. CB08]RKM61203.1 hypothetical protein D6855_04730 [Butyrivibrio sp. CB08]